MCAIPVCCTHVMGSGEERVQLCWRQHESMVWGSSIISLKNLLHERFCSDASLRVSCTIHRIVLLKKALHRAKRKCFKCGSACSSCVIRANWQQSHYDTWNLRNNSAKCDDHHPSESIFKIKYLISCSICLDISLAIGKNRKIWRSEMNKNLYVLLSMLIWYEQVLCLKFAFDPEESNAQRENSERTFFFLTNFGNIAKGA